MNILFLTQLFPYPPDTGARIKTYHTLRFLSQEHRVTLLTFLRNEDERALLPELERLCHKVKGCFLPRSLTRDIVSLTSALVRGRSFVVERDYSPPMQALVDDTLKEERFDVIHADRLQMTQYFSDVSSLNGAALVLDQHNVESEVVHHLARRHAGVKRALLRKEYRGLRCFETNACARVHHVICVTGEDRENLWRLLKKGPSSGITPRMHVVPIGVDCDKIRPLDSPKEKGRLLFVGPLNWPPNAEGVMWFARKVWPKIRERHPTARLSVVGTNASWRLKRLVCSFSGIELVSYVQDLLPELHRAEAMVVPLWAGSGLRVKILTAMAAGLAVVSTPLGYAGIRAVPGEHLLAADDADEFAQAVISVLENPFLRFRLELAGRRLVEADYDWRIVDRGLQRTYKLIEGERPAPAPLG